MHIVFVTVGWRGDVQFSPVEGNPQALLETEEGKQIMKAGRNPLGMRVRSENGVECAVAIFDKLSKEHPFWQNKVRG